MRFVLPMLAPVPVALALEYAHIGVPTAVLISVDGELNWLQGAQLLALYLMLRTSFCFIG